MRRNLVVPALAALVSIPTAQAIELSDGGDASINFGIRLQSRVEIANASDKAGDDYDIWEKESTEDPQSINFMLPRARLYMKGKYGDDWKFQLTFMADKIGKAGSTDGGDVGVRYATITRTFKTDGFKHEIEFGLNKPKHMSSHTDSSSKFLFFDARLASNLKPVDRVMGLAYSIKGDLFNAYARVSEADDADEQNGMYFSFRVETSLSEDLKIKKRTESFLGKDGFAHQLGLGLGIKTESNNFQDDFDDDDNLVLEDGEGNGDAETMFTVDYLLHYNQISALFDFAYVTHADAKSKKDDKDLKEMVIAAQAGYAIPMDDYIVEPVVRLSLVDLDIENEDEEGVYQENGKKSGMYVEGGVNVYFDGHKNKMGFYLTSYSPEEGDGDAFIARVQHQLNF